MRYLGEQTGHPVPFFCNWNYICCFPLELVSKKKSLKQKKGVCFSKQPHLLFIFTHTFLYLLWQTAQTKAQEMGGTEQDSHWAAMIKGKLTQTDTQVVQPVCFHVAHASRNHAGKCTFFVSLHCCVFFPSLCLMSTTDLSNTRMPRNKPYQLSCFYQCTVTFRYQVRSSHRQRSPSFFF